MRWTVWVAGVVALGSMGCGECYQQNRADRRSVRLGRPAPDEGWCELLGVPVVDLEQSPPVFRLEESDERSRRYADQFSLWTQSCDSNEEIWTLDRLDDQTLTYGVVPSSARELTLHRPLEDGVQYEFRYGGELPLSDRRIAWGPAYFVAGDPDSYTLDDPCQETEPIGSAVR